MRSSSRVIDLDISEFYFAKPKIIKLPTSVHAACTYVFRILFTNVMFLRLTIALSLALFSSAGSVEDTWNKADIALNEVQKKFAEVKEHAKQVEEEVMEDSKKETESVAEAESKTEESAMTAEESKAELESEKSKVEAEIEARKKDLDSSFLEGMDSSFLEIPESFAKFPQVAEDLKQLKEAEQVYKDKMSLLHQKDDELLQMANKDFEDSHKTAALMGSLRLLHEKKKKGSSFMEISEEPSEKKTETEKPNLRSSFVQKDEMPAAFQRILKAEEALRAVNEKLARDFHLS